MRLLRTSPAILLFCCIPALAQQSGSHRIRYGPGVCGPADPTYIRTAEESGGQPLFLAPNEVAKSFALVSELTHQNHVTLLWARDRFAGGHDFVVPVDSTVRGLMFSFTFDTPEGKLGAIAPDGKVVTGKTPDAVLTDLNCGAFVKVAAPEAGEWRVRISGKGNGHFWLEAGGVSDIFLVDAKFVRLGGRPGHEGYFQIPGQPVAGEPAFLQVDLSGRAQKVQFKLISLEAETIKLIAMKNVSSSRDESEYFGQITLPSKPFRVAVTGADESDRPFQRIYSSLFHSETVEVRPLEAGLEELPAGKVSTVHFKIRNAGAGREFRILAVDTRNFLSIHDSQTLSLAGGESRTVPVELNIPANTPNYIRDTVIITATATSGAATTNSAVVEFRVKAAGKN